MRTITFIGTAAAALTATMLFTSAANADRVCRERCEGSFCQTRCFDRGDRVYRYDRDYGRGYYHHRRPGLEFHAPGFGIELGR
jgi:hypothetical protein